MHRSAAEKDLLDTRFVDDQYVITVDIPDARKDNLVAGIDRNTNKIVIKKNERVLERIPLLWDSVEPTRVWFHNGLLEVRVQSDDR